MSSRLTSHLQNGMRTLNKMQDVEQLSSLVWRVMGQNPSPYTLQGTCTYLVGNGPKRILIDTGEASTSDAYLTVLASALRECGATGGIDSIVISHWHHDHLGGVRGVQNRFGPNLKVYKYIPNEEEEVLTGGKNSENSISAYESYPKDGFTPLDDGDVITTDGATLRTVFAPGHANDLCVFFLEEELSLFTSDNVLGEGTGVVHDLALYLDSLQRMVELNPHMLYPGHGSVICGRPESASMLNEYIVHRTKRVDQVFHVLSRKSSQQQQQVHLHVEEIMLEVYGSSLPDMLKGPAMYNTLMALELLKTRGQCEEVEKYTWRMVLNQRM